ncbi:MAG: isoleucine--tRNA ligase [Erysipelotrichaceae bacterium]|nr:isoleucine--tRNA ligase [Erysipelotrichaceae bacterium]
MEYKDTLHMPKTDFEMRGNLPSKEPDILKKWEDDDHYHKILEKNKDHKPFVLHDGPPYANGNLHAGTAMNRSIKDIIVRSKGMMGYYTPFFPGWDTHGLPIENAIQKLGVNRKEVSPKEFREKCEEYAHQQISQQMATEKRLGQIGDYENPYITLKPEFEARQIRSFAKMALSGMIFQGLKPIYWSPWQETAIADSEIVYFDKKDTSIFVAFDVLDGKGVLDGDERFVIWTTTPWTIPSNLAICLNEALTYAVVNTEKGKLIFLESKTDYLLEKFGLTNLGVVKTFKGRELEYITVKHPFYPERPSLVILGNHVSDEDGTGCVHTAPGLGSDDFMVGAKYGIAPFSPVDDQGCLTKEVGPDLEGKFVVGEEDDSANVAVIRKLAACDALLAKERITHSYPHDDRLKKPVIFRSTVQWFASIDKIKPQLMEAIENVRWINSFGYSRLKNMIATRKDWCISRQRLWGVPIPIIYNEDKSPIMEEEVFEHIAELFEKYGSNVWFEREAKDLLPEGYTNPKSPNGLYTKEKDIMDVWFDSGSSWNELNARNLPYPCDLYFEGSDQYRGWFNSSLIVSVACNNTAPYKSVLSHGWVCDSKGEAMHKSLGNVVNPLDIINKFGADILRLWASSQDFKSDMRIGDSNLKQVSDQYRKVRNTFRFLLGNINPEDFSKNDMVAYEDLEALDKYILVSLNNMAKKTIEAYDEYDFVLATSTMTNFMTNELSSYYCDFAKDILYCDKIDSPRRRKIQTVLYTCLDYFVKLWAPILCFTTEEVWKLFGSGEAESVHYAHFPEIKEYEDSSVIMNNFERLHQIRADIFKAREEAINNKIIEKPMQAHAVLHVSDEDKKLLSDAFGDKINQWLIISKVSFTDETLTQYDNIEVRIDKAAGHVCPRCWNVVEEENEDGLCDRCLDAIKG